MNGERALEEVRFHSGEEVNHYLHLNRALREYCQSTGFLWLKEVEDVALAFLTSIKSYKLSELGFRRIDAVWIQANTDSKYYQMKEYTTDVFEQLVSDNISDTGTDNAGRPDCYTLRGDDGLTMIVTPTPSENFPVRIDGIVDSPVATRTAEFPGPKEYHEAIVFLATAYTLEEVALRTLKQAATEGQIAAVGGLKQTAGEWKREGRRKIDKAVADTFHNRSGAFSPKKVALMK